MFKNLPQWYPFIWAVLAVGYGLCLVMLEIMNAEKTLSYQKKSWRLRCKAFFVMSQSPARVRRIKRGEA